MASQAKTPTSVSTTGFTGDSWVNITNIEAGDGNTADCTFSGEIAGSGDSLTATGFGFSIPSTATINGIQATIKKSQSSPVSGQDVVDGSILLVKAGSIAGSDKADVTTAWPSALTNVNYGSSSDLWGTSWTPSNINASNFGIQIIASAPTFFSPVASIDVVTITVFYTDIVNANVSLTGVSSSTARGNITVSGSATKTATGISSSGAVGVLTESGTASKTLTGNSSTSAAGNTSPSGSSSTSMTGLSSSSTFGSSVVAGGGTGVPSGASGIAVVGSLILLGTAAINLNGATSGSGAVGSPAGSGTAAITLTGIFSNNVEGLTTPLGTGFVFIAGIISASFEGISVLNGTAESSPVGLQVVSSLGTVLAGTNVSISGISSVSAIADISSSLVGTATIALAGVAVAVLFGNSSVSGGGTISVSLSSILVHQGDITEFGTASAILVGVFSSGQVQTHLKVEGIDVVSQVSISTDANPVNVNDVLIVTIEVASIGFNLTGVSVSGGMVNYAGNIIGGGGGSADFVGLPFTVTGFQNSVNNGTFVCTTTTASTITCARVSQVNETHAAAAQIANGTVEFFDNEVPVATFDLGTGNISFSTSTLSPGVHTLSAVYSGGNHFGGNTGSHSQTVLGLPLPTNGEIPGFALVIGPNAAQPQGDENLPPAIQIFATPNPVEANQPFTLIWESINVPQIKITDGDSLSIGPTPSGISGTYLKSNGITATTVITILGYDINGNPLLVGSKQVQASVVITVA